MAVMSKSRKMARRDAQRKAAKVSADSVIVVNSESPIAPSLTSEIPRALLEAVFEAWRDDTSAFANNAISVLST